MDELNLDLDNIESNEEKKLQVKDRYAKLSEKMALEAKAREEAENQLKVEADSRANAEKERDFFKNLSSSSTKYPNANEYQDKILEKVRKGYDTEDAIVAVLAQEGKLPNAPQPTPQPQGNVEGGSAPINLGDGGNKDLKDMSVAEKLGVLQELEKRGDIHL